MYTRIFKFYKCYFLLLYFFCFMVFYGEIIIFVTVWLFSQLLRLGKYIYPILITEVVPGLVLHDSATPATLIIHNVTKRL